MKIQHKWLKEVISTQRVHLENHHSLEVLLVQGPGVRLKAIASELIVCKGVKHGCLNVSSEYSTADLLTMSVVEPSLVRFEEVVPRGANWSHVLKRGTTLRITDTTGNANVAVLLYNFELLSERLNLPDTLSAPAHRPSHQGAPPVFGHGPYPLLHNR